MTKNDFAAVFAELRRIMQQAAPTMVVANDSPTSFTLVTPWNEARTGQPAWFGWIAIKKSYVSYHVMPLYVLASLNDAVSPELSKRRQGKTCFNFKAKDPTLFEDLRRLTERAASMEPELRVALGEAT